MQLESSVFGLGQSLLHHWDSPAASRLMVDAEISHDWNHRGLIISEQLLKLLVSGLVSCYEGGLFGIDLEAKFTKALMQISIGIDCIQSNLCGAFAWTGVSVGAVVAMVSMLGLRQLWPAVEPGGSRPVLHC